MRVTWYYRYMWTIRIDGHPTITCRTAGAALNSYTGALHWKSDGHDVALYEAGRRILPLRPWTRRSEYVQSSRQTPEWHLRAACRDIGEADKIFFPHQKAQEQIGPGEASQYCNTCPVMYQCLKSALDGNEWGTWGGMTQSERARLKQQTKPADYATVAKLRDLLEVVLPPCEACGRHRKEKNESGMCAPCFYAARRAEKAAGAAEAVAV